MIRVRCATSSLAAGLALFALTAPALHGQTTLGIRGGVSVASASLDIEETFEDANRTGFVGGAFLDWGGSGLFGFQVGAQYTQKGAEFDFDGLTQNLDLAYLEIPAVVKLGIPLGIAKPSIFGGAALGFNTSCDAGTGQSDDCDDVSSTEFSGIIGFDTALYLSAISVWFDARFHVGLNDISGDLQDVESLKNRAWLITAGLGFPLGG